MTHHRVTRSSPLWIPSGAPGGAYEAGTYDYVVVGGGTAGRVLASRLAEEPGVSVAVLEKNPAGPGPARPSRPGGRSSPASRVALQPLPSDWDEWEAAGAAGWNAEAMRPYFHRLRSGIVPAGEGDGNTLSRDFVAAASAALHVPRTDSFNRAPFTEGSGFFDVARPSRTGGRRSPVSPASGLCLLPGTRAFRLELENGRATGVHVRTADGTVRLVRAAQEIVLCAGAVGTPWLLLLSGIGPRRDLLSLGIPVAGDLPGVGANLLDHPESLIVWETGGPAPKAPDGPGAGSDAGLFVRRDPGLRGPDLMLGFCGSPPAALDAARSAGPPGRTGRGRPAHGGVAMMPTVPKPHGRGRLYLTSPDPEVEPVLDLGCLTDEEDYDTRTLVDGIRIARRVAAAEPLAGGLRRELCPGPEVASDEELSRYARRGTRLARHPAGTCRMGAAGDVSAVVDPELRVRGVAGLRVADASVFPTMPAVNPLLGVLMIGEKAADLLLRAARARAGTGPDGDGGVLPPSVPPAPPAASADPAGPGGAG